MVMSTSYQQNRPHPVPLPAFQPDYSGPVLLDALHCPLTVADNHCVLNSNTAYPHDEPDVGRRDHDDCEYDHSHTTQHSSSGGVSNPAWDGPSFARVHHVQDTNTYNRTSHHLCSTQLPSSSSAQWARQLTYPEALWMTEHLRESHTDTLEDETDTLSYPKSPYHDSQMLKLFSDATGSISPISDVSLESLPVLHEPVVLSSTLSTIANWNVLPHHQNQHYDSTVSTGGQMDLYSQAQYPLVQQHQVRQHWPALPSASSSSEYRGSRHENVYGLLLVSQSHQASPHVTLCQALRPPSSMAHLPSADGVDNEHTTEYTALASESQVEDRNSQWVDYQGQPPARHARDHRARSPVNEDKIYSQSPVSREPVCQQQLGGACSCPMAHLPHPDKMDDQHAAEHTALASESQVEDWDSSQWVEYQGQPPVLRRLTLLSDRTYRSPAGPSRLEEPLALSHNTTGPICSRSFPLIEDPPNKPLLACLFCRKRKIGCRRPPPDSPNRTCKQCADHSLKCVYAVASHRGIRPHNRDNESR